ncbi:MAG: potassium channel family protein [Marinosulfonomonas sp.]
MDLVLLFIKHFLWDLLYLAPLVIFLFGVVTGLGLAIGRIEGWTRFDAVYHAFINATTVGYGDYQPVQKSSKILSVFCAFTGLLLSGIVVAAAVHAIQVSFEELLKAGEIVAPRKP